MLRAAVSAAVWAVRERLAWIDKRKNPKFALSDGKYDREGFVISSPCQNRTLECPYTLLVRMRGGTDRRLSTP